MVPTYPPQALPLIRVTMPDCQYAEIRLQREGYRGWIARVGPHAALIAVVVLAAIAAVAGFILAPWSQA